MENALENWRKQIDALDEELLIILARRMHIVRKIGKFKRVQSLPLFDEKRWLQVLKSRLSQAKILQLPKNLITDLYGLIHKYALQVEEDLYD